MFSWLNLLIAGYGSLHGFPSFGHQKMLRLLEKISVKYICYPYMQGLLHLVRYTIYLALCIIYVWLSMESNTNTTHMYFLLMKLANAALLFLLLNLTVISGQSLILTSSLTCLKFISYSWNKIKQAWLQWVQGIVQTIL